MAYRGFPVHPEGLKVTHYTIVPGSDNLSPRPFVIYVNSSGTATFVDENGVSVEYYLVEGQTLPFSPVKVTAATASLIAWR